MINAYLNTEKKTAAVYKLVIFNKVINESLIL